MKNYIYILSLFVLLFASCASEDDNDPVENNDEISNAEQNAQDDAAIQVFLRTRYLDERGKIQAFDPNDSSDDNFTPLSDYADYLPNGTVVIQKRNIPPATQPALGELWYTYQFDAFKSTYDEANSVYSFTGYRTIEVQSSATMYPLFYQLNPNVNYPNDPSYYLMPGFGDIISQVLTLSSSMHYTGLYNAVAIIPSRNNYGRANNYYGLYREIAVINFSKYRSDFASI